MAKTIKIGGRLESVETGNIVAGANQIIDDDKNKRQSVINGEVDAELVRLDETKQGNLTFDNAPTEDSNNPVKSGGVYAADKLLSDAIEAILLLIPSAASVLNKLVDMQTMNSSIATATATFRGTYNVVSDLELAYNATHEQIAAKLDEVITTADNNDYAFVQIPVSATSQDIAKTERYKFNGEAWAYEYDLNNSGFTQAQWDAINSTITAALVSKLSALPTATDLQTALNGKQDNLTFDQTPTYGSQNPVTSGGIYARNAEIVALITALDTAKQDKLTFDSTPTQNSSNPVTSNGVYVAVSALQAAIVALDAAKQNVLTFDSTPTLGSNNPVTSSGIKTETNRLNGLISDNAAAIVTLNNLYQALTQSALVVVAPTDTWPVDNPDAYTIYRVVDRVNTPPQYYSDYMWNGTSMVQMAQYDNAIDDVPTAGSANLVKSGGVFDAVNVGAKNPYNIGAFDYAGGDGFSFDNGVYANRVSTPYYFGFTNKKVVTFDFSPSSSYDFFLGVVTEENKLVCETLSASTGTNARYIAQGDTSAPIFTQAAARSGRLLQGGRTYHMEMYCIGRAYYIFADGELVRYMLLDETLNICGIGFLNYALSVGVMSNLKTYDDVNTDIFKFKYIATSASYSNLLSHIIETGVYNIEANQGWLDAPTGLGSNGGVLEVEQATEGSVMQKYYVINSSSRATYYRLVNKSSYNSVIPWAYLDNKVVHNAESELTDAVVSAQGWQHFYDLPKNTVSCVSLSAANYVALGFPVSRAGTLTIVSPWNPASSMKSFTVYTYVTNDAHENTKVFVAFGHGSSVSNWSQMSTYKANGSGNPLAESLFNSDKVAFVGDSIVAGLGGTGYDASASGGGDFIITTDIDRYENIVGYCWVNEMISHMSSVYGKTNVHNRGVGGVNTKAVYDNFATLADGAKTVVLSCGTNDYDNNSAIGTYLSDIIMYCKTNGIKLMVMTNTPNNTVDDAMYNAVKGRITAVCSEYGVPVFDMYSEFELIRKLKGLQLSDILISDGIHPNDTGYGIMYEAALKLFGI